MLENHPTLKKVILYLLFNPYFARPRLFTRMFIIPFLVKRGRGTIVRRKSRLDLMPSKKFVLGKRCIVEDYAIINNGMGDIITGDNCLITSRVKIVGPVTLGDNVVIGSGAQITGLTHNYVDVNIPIEQQGVTPSKTTIEGDTWIGGNSCINQGITIGKHCIVASGSVVTKSVPSYSVVGGNPARILKRYNFETKEWEKVPKK